MWAWIGAINAIPSTYRLPHMWAWIGAINAIPSTYRFPASRRPNPSSWNRSPKHCTNGLPGLWSFQGRWIAIAIEQRKGAVIHALMMYGFLVLFPINPKALAR
jgi:hypothetical protein